MKLRTLITTATTAAVLSTAGVAIAGATGSSSPASSSTSSTVAASTAAPKAGAATAAHAHRRARRRHRIRVFVRTTVLATIGIDRPTLRSELRSGKTIGEIATAHNVDPSAVVNALVTGATTKLDAAANAGKITTERAQKIEAKLPARAEKFVNSWHPRRVRNAAS
jgi:hypothetical protein